MLKAGCIVLSFWAVMNLVPSAYIVVRVLTGTLHAPALYSLVAEDDIERLDGAVLATVDSVAVFANATNVGLCLLSLVTIWMALNRRAAWAFWAVLAGFSSALVAGIGADVLADFVFLEMNLGSVAILALGFSLAAFGLFSQPRDEADGIGS